MAVFSLLAVGFIMKVIAVLFVICAVVLVLIILIQKGKGGGLSAALTGGAAGGILGTKTKEPLTWITIVLVGMFLMLAVLMAKFYKPVVRDFGEGQVQRPPAQQEQPQPTESPSGIGDTGAAPGDEGTDANSLGG